MFPSTPTDFAALCQTCQAYPERDLLHRHLPEAASVSDRCGERGGTVTRGTRRGHTLPGTAGWALARQPHNGEPRFTAVSPVRAAIRRRLLRAVFVALCAA